MLDAVMYPINTISIKFDDDPIPPVGYEFSLSRDHDMIVWKKALNPELKHDSLLDCDYYEHVIVKLKIPKDAAVLFTPTKCRANRAIVLGFYACEFYWEEHKLSMTSAISWYNHSYRYNLGQEIRPDSFDHDWRRTCSHGIHFFRNYRDAVCYVF